MTRKDYELSTDTAMLSKVDKLVDWLMLGSHAGNNPKSWRYDFAYGFSRRIHKMRTERTGK